MCSAKRLGVLVVATTLAAGLAHAQGTLPLPAQVFRSGLFLPTGVTVGADGAVFVSTSREDFLTGVGTVIQKLSPDNGSLLASRFLQGLLPMQLATDPATGWIVGLHIDGRVFVLSPGLRRFGYLFGGASIGIFGNGLLPTWDVATARIAYVTGVNPRLATYGDLAVLQRGNRADLFVTGTHATRPFVMRLRVNTPSLSALLDAPLTLPSALVTMSSRATGQGGRPPGIAITRDGVGLVTLPLCGNAQCIGSIDAAIKFHADFPETASGLPTAQIGRFTSRGMTVNNQGQLFLAATGSAGIAGCGGRFHGALAFTDVAATLNYACLSAAGWTAWTTLPDSIDVATGSNVIYMTIPNGGVVIKYGL